jgi:hypothetical protein
VHTPSNDKTSAYEEKPVDVNGSITKKQEEAATKTPTHTNNSTTAQFLNKYKIKPLELDSNMIIARKLSGRMLTKKKDSNSINSNTSAYTANASAPQSNITQAYSNGAKTTLSSSSSNKNLDLKTDQIESQYKSCDKKKAVEKEIDVQSKFCNICYQSFSREEPELDLTKTLIKKNTDDTSLKPEKPDEDETNDSESNQLVQVLCGHKSCKLCWRTYLSLKIEEGNVVDMVCPQLDCNIIVPHDVVERLVSKETAEKYLQFNLKAFVDSNPIFKWCPFPGCGMAVRDPNLANENINDGDEVNNSDVNIDIVKNESSGTYLDNSEYSRAVDCGAGHYFCW